MSPHTEDRRERIRSAGRPHGEASRCGRFLRSARRGAVTEPGSTSRAFADHTYRSQRTHGTSVDGTKLHRQPVCPEPGGGGPVARTPVQAPPSSRVPARCARPTTSSAALARRPRPTRNTGKRAPIPGRAAHPAPPTPATDSPTFLRPSPLKRSRNSPSRVAASHRHNQAEARREARTAPVYILCSARTASVSHASRSRTYRGQCATIAMV